MKVSPCKMPYHTPERHTRKGSLQVALSRNTYTCRDSHTNFYRVFSFPLPSPRNESQNKNAWLHRCTLLHPQLGVDAQNCANCPEIMFGLGMGCEWKGAGSMDNWTDWTSQLDNNSCALRWLDWNIPKSHCRCPPTDHTPPWCAWLNFVLFWKLFFWHWMCNFSHLSPGWWFFFVPMSCAR